MRDLELWLEHDSTLPSDCYATVRPDDGKVSTSPMLCSQSEASHLSTVKAGDCPVIVDIYQKVGSVSLGLLEPNAFEEVNLAWPGHPGITVRIKVVAAEHAVPLERKEVIFDDLVAAKDAGAAKARTEPELPSDAAPGDEESEELTQGPMHIDAAPWLDSANLKSARGGRTPRGEAQEEQKFFKLIALDNCDQIIPNLYLGGVTAVKDKDALVRGGFRGICCCCRELEMPSSEWYTDMLDYFRVDVEDISREPIDAYFDEAADFIDSWISREQTVLVHCRAGVSRSASIVIAYLIKFHSYSLHDAFFLVRSHRSVITPNIGFMEKLGEFEAERHQIEEPTIDLNKYISWYEALDMRAAVPDLKPD